MDNYKLEEVKLLMKKNLVTPVVLENILKNSTRRIDLYNDQEAVKILKYLQSNKVIPDEVKDEINKYLAQYDTYLLEKMYESDDKNKIIVSRVTIIYLLIIVVLLVFIFLMFSSRS